MANNYNVDDYWKESFSSIISKDHFTKFLKGYPFQEYELDANKYDDFFELSSIQIKVENGKEVPFFHVKYYTYVPFQGCYEWVSNKFCSVKSKKDLSRLFNDSVCMDYEYYKKRNLGIPKILIYPLYHLHSGKLNHAEDYFFLCDLFNYDPIIKYISIGLNKIFHKTNIKGLFSEQIFVSGSIYDLYIKTVYRQAVGHTVELFPLVSKANVLDKHLVYLEELWEEFLKENKNFTDELTNRSIQWS